MKNRKTITEKSFQRRQLTLLRKELKEKAPTLESYFGLPPGAKFPPVFPGKDELWPDALPADFGKRNAFGFPITGKK